MKQQVPLHDTCLLEVQLRELLLEVVVSCDLLADDSPVVLQAFLDVGLGVPGVLSQQLRQLLDVIPVPPTTNECHQ